MSDLQVYGPLVLATDVEEAVEATLREGMPSYLAFVSRHIGKPGFLREPQSYEITSDWEHFPEERLPAILIICGEATDIEKDGRREYRATWPTRVGVFTSGKDRYSSERLAKYYAGVIREIINARGSLGRPGWSSTWKGERYVPAVPARAQRSISSSEVRFNVQARHVSSWLHGPRTLSGTPANPAAEAPALPVVKSTGLTIEADSLSGD